jgi:hypothetical protein
MISGAIARATSLPQSDPFIILTDVGDDPRGAMREWWAGEPKAHIPIATGAGAAPARWVRSAAPSSCRPPGGNRVSPMRALFFGYLLLIVAGLAYFIAVGALNS